MIVLFIDVCVCVCEQVDVILLSPERLASDSFKLNVLQPISSTLGLLVIDEVHCISVWGHDFRPEYRRIGAALQLIPADTPVLGTTATANERVLDDVKAVMGSDVTIQRGSLLRSSLALYVVRMDDTASRLAWLATNLRNMPTSSGIIYTNTRHDADQVILGFSFSLLHHHHHIFAQCQQYKTTTLNRDNIHSFMIHSFIYSILPRCLAVFCAAVDHSVSVSSI